MRHLGRRRRCECSSWAPRPGLDGASFIDCLRKPQEARETEVFAEINLPGPHAGYMLRKGNFKYCYYPNDTAELYDLAADPDEMKNLALLPEYKSKAAELQARMFAWHRPAQA